MTRRTLLIVAMAALSLGSGSAAAVPEGSGPPQRVTTVQFRFLPENILLPVGESLIYTNLDFVEHNIVSDRVDEEGKPLFEAQLITTGESAPVARVETLALGTYAFYCAPHPWMVGKLEVFDPPPGP
ncbi:MAG TPA: plastocyanin/azurin family copper-binding protein [Actinomycetota bacterium]|nr:plastocyanin/azurin family copper-binding protein [Actinomycetota bacterium]